MNWAKFIFPSFFLNYLFLLMYLKNEIEFTIDGNGITVRFLLIRYDPTSSLFQPLVSVFFRFSSLLKGIYDTYWYYDFDTILIWFASVDLWTEPTWFLTILLIVQWGIFTFLGSFIFKNNNSNYYNNKKIVLPMHFLSIIISHSRKATLLVSYESYYPFLICCSGRATIGWLHS